MKLRRAIVAAVLLVLSPLLLLDTPSINTTSAQSQVGFQHFIDSTDAVGIQKFSDCGQYWPSNGIFQTTAIDGEYSAFLRFTLTQKEKDALLCVDEYLELEFNLRGFITPAEWEDYSITTNIPGGVHDTAFMDEANKPSPAVTGVKIADLVAGVEYYAGINFVGLSIDQNDERGPRVAFELQISHWASPSSVRESTSCTRGVGAPEWCLFRTVQVYLSNGFTSHEYGQGQALSFDGYRFWEFNISMPTSQPVAEDTAPPAPTCTDRGIPVITSPLTFLPQEVSVGTDVTFTFTVRNDGCNTFAPVILAIGGHSSNGAIDDPMQDRGFSLDPGETRTITHTDSRDVPGEFKYFIVFQDQEGDWIPMADPAGQNPAVYQTVTETPTDSGSVSPDSATCSDTGTLHTTTRLSYSPESPTTATEVTLTTDLVNSSCGTFAPEVLAIGGRDPAGNVTDPMQIREFVLGPGESTTITQTAVLTSPGTHEFFMAYLRVNGGWHRIPDANGDSTSIFINVTEPPTEAIEALTQEAPPEQDGDTSQSLIEPVNTSSSQSTETQEMSIWARGCTDNYPCIGAVFTVTTTDGTAVGTCTLTGDPNFTGLIQACRVTVPLWTTVVITQDISGISPETAPVENPVYFETGDGFTTASHWGVGFQNEPQNQTQVSALTSDIAVVATEDGYPVYDACFIMLEYGNEGCDENQDGKITFEDVPVGSYTLRQTRNLGSNRSVPDSTITVTGAADADGWERVYVSVQALSGQPQAIQPSSTSTQGSSIDISLITRDPADGHLLSGTCYVLVNHSNEGCDENGDGQVTFAQIPPGVYTVHQTQTPAGYTSINDFEISISGSNGNPQGFLVRQAPEQNAPGSRNVSFVFVDSQTNQRIVSDICVEMMGASNVGCDQDLIDGQIDFLDVPQGTWQLSFSNIPAGWQVTDSAVFIDTGTGAPTHQIVVVGVQTAGSTSQSAPAQANTQEATLLMTMRGCPEGFDPNTGDFLASCTIPLDAPDASFLYHGGDGQGGRNIMWMDRTYEGAYIFTAGPNTMSVQLRGLAPVVRDGYTVVGADHVNGDHVTVNLVNGERRDLWVFYYYWP